MTTVDVVYNSNLGENEFLAAMLAVGITIGTKTVALNAGGEVVYFGFADNSAFEFMVVTREDCTELYDEGEEFFAEYAGLPREEVPYWPGIY